MTTTGGGPRTRRRWGIAVGVGAGVVAVAVAAVLVFTGVLWPNRVFAAALPVRGVDVSSYQGRIDWPVLSRQGIDFAIIKATEGSSDQDERFAANWRDARASGLVVGAYHFLSFDSSAERQAANIFRTVPVVAGTAPLTVDVELYGAYLSHPPSRERVRSILDPLLDAIEKHYGRPAILYATSTAYHRYLADAYPDNPIWYRSVALPPLLPDGRHWTFWQYSDRERLAGYDGEEAFIDMDAFGGSRQALETLLQPTGQ
ncbi:GH25 family lysozyme [uncultured Leifsonia sp.]|uniref:GH25 family lysozyme n=1 Tax=uncultured Leifsonia sp. TaxID=340359 RepID=UPI0025EDACD0|nr:GH25 family lysozyme [uncultured Leifsonia sp.]